MNLEIRKLVLSFSLSIENGLSDTLKILLGISSDENKTLGSKGSALSLKTKVDLLYDIEKINKSLYNDLITFMEIRNQFMHNIDADSYTIVAKRLKKERVLLKEIEKGMKIDFEKLKNNAEEKEKVLQASFLLLARRLINEL